MSAGSARIRADRVAPVGGLPTLAVVAQATGATPEPLPGRWLLEGAGDCATPGATLVFERDVPAVGEMVRRPGRVRPIGPNRWYVDAPDGPEGALVELDVNAWADGRLLVARRPLEKAVHVAPSAA